MRSKEAGLYKGNDTVDKGMLHSKRLTTEETPRALTTLMTLGQLVNLCVLFRR